MELAITVFSYDPQTTFDLFRSASLVRTAEGMAIRVGSDVIQLQSATPDFHVQIIVDMLRSHPGYTPPDTEACSTGEMNLGNKPN